MRKRMWKYRWIRYLLAGTGTLLAGILIIMMAPLPDPLFSEQYSTVLYSRDGQLLGARIAPDEQWRFAPSDTVSQRFITALKYYEDEYFEIHPGINPFALVRAARQNYRAGEVVSGGSTLTMQTIRLAMGNAPRTYQQKLLEIWCALKMELLYSKEEILTQYVSHAPFGGNIVGIDAASYRYFARPPHQLSWAEAAVLAILPNNPSEIYPGKNQELLRARRDKLLNKLHEKGVLTGDEVYLSMAEPLPDRTIPFPDAAAHLLNRAVGEGKAGKRIYSSLRHMLQSQANEIVSRHSQYLAGNEIHNAAALVIDLHTGEALAYVGNTDNPGAHGQQVDIITATRSPGSLLKPFLYAMAMDDGLITPYSLLPDIPVFFNGFAPKNFDKEYRGAVHANDALTGSLNVPFVHVLISYGYEKFHHNLRQLGFTSMNKPAGHYGLSIILGGAETSLWEITSVYAGMARAMYRYEERPYNSGYSDNDFHSNFYEIPGKQSYENLSGHSVIKVPSIRYALEAMRDVHRPDEEQGWKQFSSARDISWKTGTSYGFRDGWAIGLNDKYVVGVWTGNADGEGRPGLTGSETAAPILFDLFAILDGENNLVAPFGMKTAICPGSGMIAGADCPEKRYISLPEYIQNSPGCSYHHKVQLNEKGTYLVNSSCYPVQDMQTRSWFSLPPSQAWYYKKYHPAYRNLPPAAPGCLQSDKTDFLSMIYPDNNSTVRIPTEQSGQKSRVVFEAAHEDYGATVFWHLDNTFIGSTTGHHEMGILTEAGSHSLTLVDDSGRELITQFRVVD